MVWKLLPHVWVVPLFVLIFDRNQNIEEMYKIGILLSSVSNKPLRNRSTLIPQCSSVKTIDKHKNTVIHRKYVLYVLESTYKGNKKQNKTEKCVNCGVGYIGSYQGCSVAKKLQKIRDDSLGKQDISEAHLSPMQICKWRT